MVSSPNQEQSNNPHKKTRTDEIRVMESQNILRGPSGSTEEFPMDQVLNQITIESRNSLPVLNSYFRLDFIENQSVVGPLMGATDFSGSWSG